MSADLVNQSSPISSPRAGGEKEVVKATVAYSEAFPVKDEQLGPHLFKRLKLVGRGGVGKVYLVILKDTENLYAMKVLNKEDMIARNKVARVMTEREIFATANHPFIVTMYASFQTSKKLHFLMDYCEGGEFFRVLQKQPGKRLTEDAARFYAAEVILALEYLHHLGFIYRDLKPENVLMRGNGHIALTDFDLSKQATAVAPVVVQSQISLLAKLKSSFKKDRTALDNLDIVTSEPVLQGKCNSFVGTEEYIAPEVVNGSNQSASVDWWTLGILIYEMVFGCTPFKGAKQTETFHNIMNRSVTFPADIPLSKEGKDIIKKLLTRESNKRLGGSGQGASEIRKHKWFAKLDFALLLNTPPPIKPVIQDPLDMSQYKPLKDDDNDHVVQGGEDNVFSDFDMRRDD
uniref:non-specific serine/threonine protein kinase n=1 Tax=Timspurckia oligopyrenoides TaxID=708627 RepID=A0A7S0ZAT7_9RHOD|mmetsp:Transcript_10510/g.18961  ORF Transcript_10510/g.18961 Transcript_10510/m.18961 type:complete len:403 (+) Transcript_10510:172-1380(+)